MNISTLGRCIDQPLVLNKLHKKMPALLISSGIGFGVYDTIKSSKNCDVKNKKTNFIKLFKTGAKICARTPCILLMLLKF